MSGGDVSNRFPTPVVREQIAPHAVELQVSDIGARSYAHERPEYRLERAPTDAGVAANLRYGDSIREAVIDVLSRNAKKP